MKRFIFFARVYFVLLSCSPLALAAQEVDSFPNYVVIGAFAHHKNAVNFTGEANQNKFPARFEMNPNRNLYYVYVLSTPDRTYAIAEAVKLRAETKYWDTWVYSGPLGSLTLANGSIPQGEDINPVTGLAFPSLVSKNESGTEVSPLASHEDGNAPPDEDATLHQGIAPGADTSAATQAAGRNNGRRNRRANRSGERVQQSARQDTGKAEVSPEVTPGERGKNQTDPEEATALNTAQPGHGGGPSATAPGEQADRSPANPVSGVNGGTEIAVRNDPATLSSPERNGDQRTRETATPTDRLSASADRSGGKQGSQGDEDNNGRQEAAVQDSGLPAQGSGTDARRVLRDSVAGSDNATYADGPKVGDEADGETQNVTNNVKDPLNKSTSVVQGPPPKRMTSEPLKPEEVVGKNFYFHIFRADNANMIQGEVDAIDFARSRKMATYPGNTPVAVKMPSGKTQHVSFLCQVFGYRKQQKEFDPNSLDQDLYLDDKGNVVVPFELIRLQKGDIAIMYNVFFFKDAAVMRPESRYEVNNLLALLEENPTYKIMIHGHTNGNAGGKIIRMDTPGNFYSLSGTKQGFGSAKKLSEERASVIREFLISSGINQERMQIKAWGGKKPIHDKHSVRAHENVRVEIEILPD